MSTLISPGVGSNCSSSSPGTQLSWKFRSSLARASLASIRAKRMPVGGGGGGCSSGGGGGGVFVMYVVMSCM